MPTMIPRFALLLVLLSSFAVGDVPETDGKASKIKPAHLQKLRIDKYRLLLPTFVPAGYTVAKADLQRGETMQETVFELTYKNAKTKAEIIVQMASEGLGSPMFTLANGEIADATGSITAKSPIFGKVKMEVLKEKKERQFHCEWIDLGKKAMPRFVMIYGVGAEAADGKQMLESLRFFKHR
jgi:hypothetical protein